MKVTYVYLANIRPVKKRKIRILFLFSRRTKKAVRDGEGGCGLIEGNWRNRSTESCEGRGKRIRLIGNKRFGSIEGRFTEDLLYEDLYGSLEYVCVCP